MNEFLVYSYLSLQSKIDKFSWSAGSVPSLSWLRPTYYADAVVHQSSQGIRGIISAMCEIAKARRANEPILHTYVLAFGLALRYISAAVAIVQGKTCDPPFWRVSALNSADFDFVVSELKELLKHAGHPSYVVEVGKRQTRSTNVEGE